MDRRSLFAGLAGVLSLPILSKAAEAAPRCYDQNKNSVKWTVPNGIDRIRVRSWSKDGDEVIDTHFSVKPGQVFQIDVVR